MSSRTPAASCVSRPLACRHRAVLGSHTVPAATTRFSEDDLLLFLLTSTWELSTGRRAPAVPPADMTEEELIEYWSEPIEDRLTPLYRFTVEQVPGPASPKGPSA